MLNNETFNSVSYKEHNNACKEAFEWYASSLGYKYVVASREGIIDGFLYHPSEKDIRCPVELQASDDEHPGDGIPRLNIRIFWRKVASFYDPLDVDKYYKRTRDRQFLGYRPCKQVYDKVLFVHFNKSHTFFVKAVLSLGYLEGLYRYGFLSRDYMEGYADVPRNKWSESIKVRGN